MLFVLENEWNETNETERSFIDFLNLEHFNTGFVAKKAALAPAVHKCLISRGKLFKVEKCWSDGSHHREINYLSSLTWPCWLLGVNTVKRVLEFQYGTVLGITYSGWIPDCVGASLADPFSPPFTVPFPFDLLIVPFVGCLFRCGGRATNGMKGLQTYNTFRRSVLRLTKTNNRNFAESSGTELSCSFLVMLILAQRAAISISAWWMEMDRGALYGQSKSYWWHFIGLTLAGAWQYPFLQ